MEINKVTSTSSPALGEGAKTGVAGASAPEGSFQVALNRLFAVGDRGDILSQQAALREIAAKYDPRDLSFNERREMIRELKQAGFLTVEAAAMATAYVRPAHMTIQPGETQAAFAARLEEWQQSNPAFNQKIDYMGHLWWRASTFGYDATTTELLNVSKLLLQVRQSDPDLSDLPQPPARSTVDPLFRVDDWPSSGNSFDMLISSDYDDELAQKGYRLDIRLVLQWVRKAVGLDDKDEEKAEGDAEAAAAAEGEETAETVEATDEADGKAETKDQKKPVEEEWELVRMAIVVVVKDDPLAVHLDRLAFAMLGGVDDTEGDRQDNLKDKIKKDQAPDTDINEFTQIAKEMALKKENELVILRNDGGFHQGWSFSIDGMAKRFAQMASDEDAEKAQLLPEKMLEAEVRVSDRTETEAAEDEPGDAEKVAEFRGDGEVAWI